MLCATLVPAARAQARPTIALKPDCGPERVTTSVTVTGASFSTRRGTVSLAVAGTAAGSATPDANGNFTATVAIGGRGPGTYDVTASQGQPPDVATARFTIPCPGATTTTTTSTTATSTTATTTTITTTTRPTTTTATTTTTTTRPTTTTTRPTTTTTSRPTTTTTRPPTTTTRPPTTTTSATTTTSSTTSTSVPVPATVPPPVSIPPPPVIAPPLPRSVPALVFDPPLGPPGFVTALVGAGYPPGADVLLEWRLGGGGPSVRSDAAGSFRVGVLLLHHEPLGGRTMTGTAVAPADAAAVATAPFLVVPGTVQPSGPNRGLEQRR